MLAAAAARVLDGASWQDASPKPSRVLVVYGSETGNSKRGIEQQVEYWRSHNDGTYVIRREDVLTGNALAGALEGTSALDRLRTLASKWDVLIVATSSFGEGDPPENFVHFLVTLVRGLAEFEALRAETPEAVVAPLSGLQHAVLGYGQAVYKTYQNTPRLTDRHLGELGSRRFARRVELDEGPNETAGTVQDEAEPGMDELREPTSPSSSPQKDSSRSGGLYRFRTDVHAALQLASSSVHKPDVCPWHVPGDGTVREKSEEDLLCSRPQRLDDSQGFWQAAPLALLVVVAVMWAFRA